MPGRAVGRDPDLAPWLERVANLQAKGGGAIALGRDPFAVALPVSI
ncbi:MAG: hypothetical protein AAF218_06905 [Pseudomonadota bacterium]